MAAKKSAKKKVAKGKAITGTVRFNGQTYAAGDEAALEEAMKDAEVTEVRGYGVDSTDRGTAAVRNDTERGRIAARQAQAEAEARGEVEVDEDDDDENEPDFGDK